ncbi:MAG: SpoIIE family protein phosphatase [Bacteroidales bacterium]|nr:SpoIIE family protein phosphatase [Bacteroidales bacterium]
MTPIRICHKNKSFSYYLSIYVLGIVIIVFTFFLIYNYNISRKLLLKNVEENAQHLSTSAVNKIESFFSEIEKTTQNAASIIIQSDSIDFQFHRIIKDMVLSNPEIYGSCFACKPIISKRDTVLNAPYYYKTNKKLSFKNLADKNYDYILWDWYRIPATEHRSVWSEPYYDEGGGNVLMTTYAMPAYKKKGDTTTFFGVLTADVSIDWLNEMLNNIHLIDNAYVFLISNTGNILSHPDSTFIMNKNISEYVKKEDNSNFQTVVHHMILGKSGFEKIRKDFYDNESWIFYTPLANKAWSLGFVFPKDELYADLHLLQKDLLLILLSGILVLTFFILFVSAKLTKPIRHLADLMHKDSEAFIHMQIPNFISNKEINMLTSSFRNLQNELNKYIAHLKEITISKERIESELQLASKVQISMLPCDEDADKYKNKINIHAYIHASKEVGGDLYDYFFLDDSHLFFVIGDVSGKGMGAAMFMTSTLTLLRAHAKIAGNNLCRILQITSDYLEANNPDKYFVTLFTGIFNITTHELNYVNAGHTYPVILSENTEIILMNHTHMLPLGIIKPKQIISSQCKLHPNDTLFLYTDGVTEAMNTNNELFGTTSLLEILKNYSQRNKDKLIPSVCQALKNFTTSTPQHDDISMLCIQVKESLTDEVLHLSFKNVQSISILNEINSQAEHFLENKDVPTKTMHRVKLVIEELVTNAFKYGFLDTENKQLAIDMDITNHCIEIVYRDNGQAFDICSSMTASTQNAADITTIGKRGLSLINKLTEDFFYKRENNLNISSFKIPIP